MLTFEKTFVTDFDQSTTRRPMRQIVGGGFYQWIDGSFVTQKLNPKDVDFVTFIDAQIFEQNEKNLEKMRGVQYVNRPLLDSYFVATYDDIRFECDRLYWFHKFEKDDRKRFKNKKGFIKLKF
ncbi:MAG: hypothetical protein EAZ46_10770 [Runella sp.]|nr:MAG: hypothetical protein EAZ46_10770 [Runella sp.]